MRVTLSLLMEIILHKDLIFNMIKHFMHFFYINPKAISKFTLKDL